MREGPSDEAYKWRSIRSSPSMGKPCTWQRDAGNCGWITEIFAKSDGFLMNIEEVQRKLWEQSLKHKEVVSRKDTLFAENAGGYRIKGLYDLMHQPDWIQAACERVLVRSRGKSSGIDAETVHTFSESAAHKLENLRQEVRNGSYQPKPVKRVMISKRNGKERPLGLPCLRDKIVQEAMRMALEPIFEAEFHDSSYGFRPNRNTHQAVYRCQRMLKQGFTWVVEGDVKACFDEISHKAILRCLREKTMDNKFLKLTSKFLKAGVWEDGIVRETVKGVPQGGVLSPLLANIVLNKLDWLLHKTGTYGEKGIRRNWGEGMPNTRFVRYADDWCVFITRANKQYAQRLRDDIAEFLSRECGLSLSMEKTRITHVRDGFDFLGFHLEAGTGRNGGIVPKIKIPRDAVARIEMRFDEAMRFRPHQESIASRIQRGSSVLRGCANYYKIAYNLNKVAGIIDNHAHWSAIKTISRKYGISTGKAHRRYYKNGTIVYSDDCQLAKFHHVKQSLYVKEAQKYIPGNSKYHEDHCCPR